MDSSEYYVQVFQPGIGKPEVKVVHTKTNLYEVCADTNSQYQNTQRALMKLRARVGALAPAQGGEGQSPRGSDHSGLSGARSPSRS